MSRVLDDLGIIAILALNAVLWVAMVIFLLPIMIWWTLTSNWPPEDDYE